MCCLAGRNTDARRMVRAHEWHTSRVHPTMTQHIAPASNCHAAALRLPGARPVGLARKPPPAAWPGRQHRAAFPQHPVRAGVVNIHGHNTDTCENFVHRVVKGQHSPGRFQRAGLQYSKLSLICCKLDSMTLPCKHTCCTRGSGSTLPSVESSAGSACRFATASEAW